MNLQKHCFVDLQLTLTDETIQFSAHMKQASPENSFPLAALRHLCNARIGETFPNVDIALPPILNTAH